MTEPLDRFRFRSGRLYEGIVRLAREGDSGIGWMELLARVDPLDEWAERTIEGAIRDLVVGGFCAVSGTRAARNRPDARRVHVTPCGAAVVDGELLAVPWRREREGPEDELDEPVGSSGYGHHEQREPEG